MYTIIYSNKKVVLSPDVSFSVSGHRSKISTPIFMDTVACSGSESKLISCTYHRGTSEDEHSEDIRVHCAQNTPSSNTNTGNTYTIKVSLIVSISVISLFSMLLVMFF